MPAADGGFARLGARWQAQADRLQGKPPPASPLQRVLQGLHLQ